MKKITIIFAIILLFVSLFTKAEDTKGRFKIHGKIIENLGKTPLSNVQVFSLNSSKSFLTEKDGFFTLEVSSLEGTITFAKSGYITIELPILGREEFDITMNASSEVIPSNSFGYEDIGSVDLSNKTGSSQTLNSKQWNQNYSTPDEALIGRIAGLHVLQKSGFAMEGNFINLRGVRSLVGENHPLIVVNGIPYLPDVELSPTINGFSKNIMLPLNLKEISKITLLKGADAAAYGSLGSNGVLYIETEQSTDMDTKIEVQSVNGVGFINRTLPMLNSENLKNYISDIASSYYIDPDIVNSKFHFLGKDPNNLNAYKYDENIDWQERIYTPAFTTDNILKIKGGDAVVKLMLTTGYQQTKGVLDNSKSSKFFTRVNTNVKFNPRLNAIASVAFNYTDMELHEQGMSAETNPMLAAYGFSPLTPAYQRDYAGRKTTDFTPVDISMGASNPMALLEGAIGKNTMYDILINTGLAYDFTSDLRAGLYFGVYYNFTKDDMFIGGKSSKAIAPLMGGLAENSVRSGAAEVLNYYIRGNISYEKMFNHLHLVNISGGYQLMNSRKELDSGSGINTASDKYQDLSNVNKSMGRFVTGYIEPFNWMNAYLLGKYHWNNQYFIEGGVTVDAASTFGSNSGRFFFYPNVKLGWNIHNSPFLRNNSWFNKLAVRGEFSQQGNSRFDSRLGRYSYQLNLVRDISGLQRSNIPNLEISPEQVTTINLGVDFISSGHNLSFSIDLFDETVRDLIVQEKLAEIYGFDSYYSNSGQLNNRGIDASLSVNILNQRDWSFNIGGNISYLKSEVKSLGGYQQQITTIDEDAAVAMTVGDSPYSFYGHQSEGVFIDNATAQALGRESVGEYEYRGGDIIFSDLDGDNIISNDDRTVLGSALPDIFGGFNSQLRYKQFTLYANFSYSFGNEVYNAVRRLNESTLGFTNQANSVGRRWVSNGQETDIPRAEYGDPAGNNRFSSRWIEDGSFVKLKELTLSYTAPEKIFFFHGLQVFATAENIWYWSKYKGSDPEFSYSYDLASLGMDMAKLPIPAYYKLGLILNF